MEKIKKQPIFTSILASEIVSLIIGLFSGFGYFVKNIGYIHMNDIVMGIIIYLLIGIFIIHPIVLTCINIVFIFINTEDSRWLRVGKVYEYTTIALGVLYSGLVLTFYKIDFSADWTKVLYNNQTHTPIWTEGYFTIILIAIISIAGYLLLSLIPIKNMPPLVIVSGISALYLGIAECVLWIVQIFAVNNLILCLFPLNCIIIAVKTIKNNIYEWNEIQHEEKKTYKYKILSIWNEKLMQSNRWPIAAFLLMWPLLGILICILVLFGQEPDAVIRAWTETSDWNLSQRVAPQNLYYDEHYLCTVAAGGHKKIVKPLRLGRRHGHEVIVNRQLCVANAFEQILEEKTPVLHRNVRSFYDTYGFPIAKLIHSPYIADIVFFAMKPLEWFFLIVLYFCDVKPENRIAIQYMPPIKRC